MIDGARGKGPHYTPTPDVAALLDTARAHKASLAVVIDIAIFKAMLAGTLAKMPAPMLWTFGTDSGQAQMRIVVPVASARALVQR